MKKAILFDFDYTLADSSRGVVECINYALKSMGIAERRWNECCATIGLSLSETFESLTGDRDPENAAVFFRLFVERADEIMAANTELYDGVKDLLLRLKSSGLVLGILSTKFRYRICQILDRYELTELFSVIIGGEDVERHKPDPEGLRLFLLKLSLQAKDVILVGDSLVDAETARRGDMDFVAVLTGTTIADQFSDYSPIAILDSVTEIRNFAV